MLLNGINHVAVRGLFLRDPDGLEGEVLLAKNDP
jgi:hypothetical protein